MKRVPRYIFGTVAIAIMLTITGCVVVPARPAPYAVWVPGHWVAAPYGSVWVRGHWRG